MSISKFWPAPDRVNACIQPEAEIPPAAVLLAVHRPMQFQFVEGGEHRAVQETFLLEKLLDPNVERGTALLTVRGSSGVGKSHAIRWLEAKLRARPDSTSRHIILLPKSTSLKGAIKLILADLEGPRFEQLKKQLKTAHEHLELSEAAVRLRTNLELEIQRRIDQATAAVAAARARGESAPEKDRMWQTHKALRDVILHPGLRSRWVGVSEDNEPQGVLAEVAARVLKDGRIINEQTRLQFTPDDLTFEPHELQDVAGQTKSYLTNLGSGDGKQRKIAVQLLNGVIDDAANQLLDLGDSGLKDIFDEIRRELLRQKKELIVLVEDFAVLSGMQGALLDALIKEAIEKGETVRCTMRTALAVTTGYQLPATVLTRATGDFLIEDMPFQEDESALDAIVELVGRYLNAARMGSDALKAAYDQRGTKNQNWVPRFEETLELEDADRAALDAFGFSHLPDGFSLFPFNRAALRQLAALRFRKTDQGEPRLEFKPRDILKLVVRKTLMENTADFKDGKFPPASYNEADSLHRVSPAVAEEIRKSEPDPAKRGRLMALVRFWADNPASARKAEWKLPVGILRTFGFRDLGTGYIEPSPPAPAVAPETPKSSPSVKVPTPTPPVARKEPLPEKPIPSTPFEKSRATIDDWLSGRLKILPQEDSRQLRHWIAADVLASINWDLEMLPLPTDQHLRTFRDMVYLERAAGKGNASEDDCSILAVSREDLSTPESADAVGLALHALVRAKLEEGWSFDTTGESYTRWANFILPKRAHALEFLRARYGADLIAPAAKALYLGTRLLNIPGAHSDSQEEFIKALFEKLPAPFARPAANARPGTWESLKRSAAEQREPLQKFVLRFLAARTAGTGNTHALNSPALLSALGNIRTTLALSDEQVTTSDEPDLKPAVEHAKQLSRHFRTALTKQADDCRQRIQRVSQALGASPDKDAIKKTAAELSNKCSTLLSISYEHCENIRRAAESFANSAYQNVDVAPSSAPQASLLTFAASVNEENLAIAETLVEEFEKFTGAVEHKLRLGALSSGPSQLKSEQVDFQKEIAQTAALAGVAVSQTPPLSSGEPSEASQPKRKSEKAAATDERASTTGQLLLKCQQLAHELSDYADREKFKLKADSLRAHKEKFESARLRLDSAMRPWTLLQSRRVPGVKAPLLPAEVKNGLPQIFARITEKPEQINAGRVMADCLNGIESLAQNYRNNAVEAWTKYKDSTLYVGVPSALVQTFRQLPAFAAKASELENALKRLENRLLNIPESEQQWRDCESASNACKQLLKKLPLDDLPKDVRKFLEETVSGGAPLSSLTESVRDWIKTQGLERSFLIRSATISSNLGRLF